MSSFPGPQPCLMFCSPQINAPGSAWACGCPEAGRGVWLPRPPNHLGTKEQPTAGIAGLRSSKLSAGFCNIYVLI